MSNLLRNLDRLLSEEHCKKLFCLELAFIVLFITLFSIGVGQDQTNRQSTQAYGSDDIIPVDVQSAVAKLRVFKKDHRMASSGTGFFISGDGLLITCYHVIKDAHLMTAIAADGKSYSVEGVIAVDEAADLALLQVNRGIEEFAFLDISEKQLTFGDTVSTVGYPMGGFMKTVTGKFHSGGQILPICQTIQLSVPVLPGCSGSPVLNAKGEVVGVVKAHMRREKHFPETFATPVAKVSEMVL
jgi:S1-C subfamily serine protease